MYSMTIRRVVEGEGASIHELYNLSEQFFYHYKGYVNTEVEALERARRIDFDGKQRVLIRTRPIDSDNLEFVSKRLKNPSGLFDSGQIYPPPATDATPPSLDNP